MLTKKIAVAGILLAVGLWPLSRAAAQRAASPDAQDRDRERHSLAVNIVRAINTAEVHYKQTTGTYVDWKTLLSNGDFSNTGTKWSSESMPTVAHALYGPEPEIVPGWKLRLILSKDSTSYSLSLEDVNDPKCTFTVFSDDRGVIHQGRSITCPA